MTALLAIAVLLSLFGFIAHEVASGKPTALDRCVTLALRSSADPCRPIGPALGTGSGARYNQSGQHRRRNHNSRGCRMSLPGSQARRRLADAARGGGRHCAEQPAQTRVRAPTTQCHHLFGTRHYDEFSQRPCDAVGDRVSDHRSSAVASFSVSSGKPLSHGIRRVSDRAHRLQSKVLGRSLSDRRLAGWCIGAAWAIFCWVMMVWLQNQGQVGALTTASISRDLQRPWWSIR